MREYSIEARNVKNPLYRAPIDMGGSDDKGNELSIGNYYLKINDAPFYAICGEAHFSRINEKLWEDEILKMKMGGLNIIATYIFWIHHEEIRGQYDWSGNKNLRRFIELCRKHEMYVILRIGPFVHGECRNGGFPDWIFGCPFDIRCDDERYLKVTETFYREIYRQADGLLYKDGGPVIAVQIENEHEHASCPWEMTTENSKEWVVPGRDGVNHMATLRKLATDVGFEVPLYTATAWGGACAPIETVFPLWGGYAFRPWMFYDENLKEHPATAEYLYGDFHNNSAPQYYNFDPEYPAEDFPYACCEMGGGMNVYYPYRFQLPYESVGAMAQVKVGSGCNFLGYYMYHGGTHPKGKRTPYLNECAVPKFSYDYQAPIGEFGQIRPSFHQLKLQHLFYSEFTAEIAAAKTVLSEEARVQVPEDVDTLRYVVRIDESGKGFLFINNYQDHVDSMDQKDFAVSVCTDKGTIRVPESGGIDLSRGGSAILPVWFEIGQTVLRYATGQLVTRVENEDSTVFFFTQVPGMRTEYVFEAVAATDTDNCTIYGNRIVVDNPEQISTFSFRDADSRLYTICTLTTGQAAGLWQVEYRGKRRIILSEAPVFVKDEQLVMEYPVGTEVGLQIYPDDSDVLVIGNTKAEKVGSNGIFDQYAGFTRERTYHLTALECSSKNSEADGILKRPVVGSPISSTKIINARKIIKIDESDFDGLKQLLIRIHYEGDIGYAFIDGEMIHDNFCNGAAWEFDLMPYKDAILNGELYIYISPKKKGAYVDSSSSMAARFEVVEEQVAKITNIELLGIENVVMEF